MGDISNAHSRAEESVGSHVVSGEPIQHNPLVGGRLAVNMALVTVSFVVASACMFATDLLVIKGYGRGCHDQVTVLVSMMAIGVLLADLGLASKAGVRLIAQNRSTDRSLLPSTVGSLVLTLGFTAAIIGGGIVMGAGWLTEWFHGPAYLLRLAAVWLLAGAGIRACAMVSFGFEQMSNLVLISGSAEVLRLGWAAVCVACGWPAEWLYVGWTAAWLLALLLGIGATKRLLEREGVRPVFRSTWARISGMIVEGAPYQVSMITAQGLPAVVLLLVGGLLTDESSVGQVSTLRVVFSLAMIIRIVSQSMATSLFPLVARVKAVGNNQSVGGLFNQLIGLLGAVATGLYAGFWALGQTVLGWIGPDYIQGWYPLLVLCVAMGIECYRVQIDQLLMGDKYVKLVAWLEVLKLILIWLLIYIVVAWMPIDQVGLSVAIAVLVGVLVTGVMRVYLTRGRVDALGGLSVKRTVIVLAWLTAIGCVPLGWYMVIPAWMVLVVITRLVDWRILNSLFASGRFSTAVKPLPITSSDNGASS